MRKGKGEKGKGVRYNLIKKRGHDTIYDITQTPST